MESVMIMCILCKKIELPLFQQYEMIGKELKIPIFMISDESLEGIRDIQQPFCHTYPIYISDEISIKNGYQNMNYLKKNPSAWDKVFYFLQHEISIYIEKYDFVWILEDDVAIRSVKGLKAFFREYEKNRKDILCMKLGHYQENKEWVHWNYAEKHFPLISKDRYWKGFFPISRFSKRMVDEIVPPFTFLECFLPILCNLKGMEMENLKIIDSAIRFRPSITLPEMYKIPSVFYHPCKDFRQNVQFLIENS